MAAVTTWTMMKPRPGPKTASAICALTVRSMPSNATTFSMCVARKLMPRNIETAIAPMTASVVAALRLWG